ncbi:MAG: 2-oxoacid:acceptor oxidoreductase subunit alpha [Acidobacteriota bacterium]
MTIRIAGDSGDGIQLAGGRFAGATALAGNDLATLPDFPAEIRAPAGTLPGVSGYQIQFASTEVLTPGDRADVLVAFNPAALRVNLPDLRPGGVVIVNSTAFEDETGLRKAGYETNPLEDGSLDGYRVHPVAIGRLTREALADSGLGARQVERCKNFFALGLLSWMFARPLEPTLRWIERRFRDRPDLAEANRRALTAGYHFGDTARLFETPLEIPPAEVAPGVWRALDGNEAIALALATLAERSGLDVLLASYPITPASTVLHRTSRLEAFGVTTFQAEDEIGAVGAALGASFAGGLGVTTTSGPGLALKGEFLGLAVMTELPLVVIDIQRGGPSTGLPTRTEQADLLMALFGRHGEAPLPVLAPRSPGDCFWTVLEAARIALRSMTPVVVLSEGYLANGSEPFRVPGEDELPEIRPRRLSDPQRFEGTYVRDPETLARPWIAPGTPGLEHRIGGLEKDELGRVSYDPDNHERMVAARAAKIARIADDLPPAALEEGEPGDDLLVIGWGGTWGAITEAVRAERAAGRRVASLHLRHLNPLPRGLAELAGGFPRVLVAERNCGQLALLLRGRLGLDVESFTRVRGIPFVVAELRERIAAIVGGGVS